MRFLSTAVTAVADGPQRDGRRDVAARLYCLASNKQTHFDICAPVAVLLMVAKRSLSQVFVGNLHATNIRHIEIAVH
jgi:hypothetical protein